MKKYLIILALSAVFFTGCTRTEKHIAAGAAVGAVAGHAIGEILEQLLVLVWEQEQELILPKKNMMTKIIITDMTMEEDIKNTNSFKNFYAL